MLSKADIGIWQSPVRLFYLIYNGGDELQSTTKNLGKPLTKIIIVIQKIWFTTSPDRTTITPEKIGSTIEKMVHGLPIIWSWVSDGLFSSIVRTQTFMLSGHIHVYLWDIYVKGQLIRLPWYHQNPRYRKLLIQPTMALNIENTDL